MKIIIAGAYAIGTHLARLLSREHDDIVVIEPNEERLAGIGQDVDILTMEASPTSIKALKQAGAEDADLFIGVTPNECQNMTACTLAKALGTKKTVAKVDNSEYIALSSIRRCWPPSTSTTDLRCRGLGSVGTYTMEPLLCWA